MGACRTNELHAMTVQDIEDLGSAILVTIPITKTKVTRKFSITGNFFHVVKNYAALRPQHVNHNSFFLNYQKGKCTTQRIGVNKLASMGKQIATYLKLPNPELYTGHSFRRSSATLLVDAGADITALKRHGGWKSTAVAEGYIDTSMANKMDAANKILHAVQASSSGTSSSTTAIVHSANKSLNVDVNSPPFSITNNYGTVNIYINKKTG